MFNPNVNNLESHSPPKSPENGGILNSNPDPHQFSYGNKNQQNRHGSFSNKSYGGNNNFQSQPNRNQYGHSGSNSQFNGNNYQSPQVKCEYKPQIANKHQNIEMSKSVTICCTSNNAILRIIHTNHSYTAKMATK